MGLRPAPGMSATHIGKLLMVLLPVLLTFTPLVANSAGINFDVAPNFFGIGIGTTPDYIGSNDYMVGAAPAFRYQFWNNRFIEWYGTYGDINLLNYKGLEFGPALNIRLGRDDVKDSVVDRLPSIDATVEGGFYAGYHYVHKSDIPFRLRLGTNVMGDLGGVYSGLSVTPWASIWLPLRKNIFIGFGAGGTYASGSFMREYFGVTPAGSIRSGLPTYTPDAGFRQFFCWPALLVKLGKFFVGGGVYYQRLVGDAADSPIVSERGSANQFTGGLGVGYYWQ